MLAQIIGMLEHPSPRSAPHSAPQGPAQLGPPQRRGV